MSMLFVCVSKSRLPKSMQQCLLFDSSHIYFFIYEYLHRYCLRIKKVTIRITVNLDKIQTRQHLLYPI